MRIRTSLSIAILAGALVAIPLYLGSRSDPVPESPAGDNASAPQPAVDDDVDDLYCAERTAAGGVMVRTGPDCARHGSSTGSHAPTVTVTREQGTLVITGSDP